MLLSRDYLAKEPGNSVWTLRRRSGSIGSLCRGKRGRRDCKITLSMRLRWKEQRREQLKIQALTIQVPLFCIQGSSSFLN